MKQFHRIASAKELFAWLQGPFLALSYPSSSSSAAGENDLIFQNNRVVGGIRIGQLRVKKSNCTSRITSYFSSALAPTNSSSDSNTLYCYGSKSGDFQGGSGDDEDELQDTFGGSAGESFPFAGQNGTDTALERSAQFSSMADTGAGGSGVFPAPAFSVVLPRANAARASQILSWLESDAYIDQQTRVVMLDVNLYNVMLQYILVVRFVFEFPSSGGVTAKLVTTSAPITRSFLYYSDEVWQTLCSLVVLVFYVYFLVTELLAHTGRRRKAATLKALRWSARYGSGARTLSLVFYFLVWLMRLIALIKFPKTFPLESDAFVALRPFAEAFHISQHLLAINTCLCWLVMLLLLRVSKNIDIFIRTILLAKTKLLSLLLCMAILFYGYASAFVVAIGSQSRPYGSIASALTSLLGVTLGIGGSTTTAIATSQQQNQDATMEIVLFAGFLALNLFVIANLVLVVIYEAYRKAVEEAEYQQQQSSSKRIHLLVEMVRYAKSLCEQLRDTLQRLSGNLHFVHTSQKKLVSRTSKMSVVHAISSSGVMQKSAQAISKRVGALSDFGGRLVHSVVSSEREEDDDCFSNDLWQHRNTRSHNNSSERGSSDHGFNLSRGNVLPGGSCVGTAAGARQSTDRNSRSGGDSAATTKLLQGMILQLALQNESLMRSIDDVRKDVKALAAIKTMDNTSRHLLSPSLAHLGGKQHSRRQTVVQQQQQQIHALVKEPSEVLERVS